jgi:hypothetical protein
MIPKTINYIFGLRQDFCGKPFTTFHYLNIVSAWKCNPGYKINVYYYYKPEGWQFEALSTFCNVIKLDYIPATLAGKNIPFGEMACGYMRVCRLLEEGGIYLDTDVVCLKSFDDLLDEKCVMGLEYSNKQTWGLCDAVILAEKGSDFLSLWKNNYEKNFYPEYWSMDAVIVPYEIAINNPKTIKMVPTDFFFKFPWDDIGDKLLFKWVAPVDYAYCLHLYESRPGRYNELCKYTIESVPNMRTTLSYIYRKVVFEEKNLEYPRAGSFIIPKD